MTINGRNDGNGAAAGTDLLITLPASVALTQSLGANWNCQAQVAQQHCVQSDPVPAGSAVAPLVLKVSAASTAVPPSSPIIVKGTFVGGTAQTFSVPLTILPAAPVTVLGIERPESAHRHGQRSRSYLQPAGQQRR